MLTTVGPLEPCGTLFEPYADAPATRGATYYGRQVFAGLVANYILRRRNLVIPELHPVTCGRAVSKPVDNRCQVRITARFLWVLCG